MKDKIRKWNSAVVSNCFRCLMKCFASAVHVHVYILLELLNILMSSALSVEAADKTRDTLHFAQSGLDVVLQRRHRAEDQEAVRIKYIRVGPVGHSPVKHASPGGRIIITPGVGRQFQAKTIQICPEERARGRESPIRQTCTTTALARCTKSLLFVTVHA